MGVACGGCAGAPLMSNGPVAQLGTSPHALYYTTPGIPCRGVTPNTSGLAPHCQIHPRRGLPMGPGDLALHCPTQQVGGG